MGMGKDALRKYDLDFRRFASMAGNLDARTQLALFKANLAPNYAIACQMDHTGNPFTTLDALLTFAYGIKRVTRAQMSISNATARVHSAAQAHRAPKAATAALGDGEGSGDDGNPSLAYGRSGGGRGGGPGGSGGANRGGRSGGRTNSGGHGNPARNTYQGYQANLGQDYTFGSGPGPYRDSGPAPKRGRTDGRTEPKTFFDSKSHPDGHKFNFSSKMRKLLTIEEQEWFTRLGQCFYCSNVGHNVESCHTKQRHFAFPKPKD